jgi:hypothetical protein
MVGNPHRNGAQDIELASERPNETRRHVLNHHDRSREESGEARDDLVEHARPASRAADYEQSDRGILASFDQYFGLV